MAVPRSRTGLKTTCTRLLQSRTGSVTAAKSFDAQIAARKVLPALAPMPEPNFSPAPLPVVDAPADFARAFWKGRKVAGPDDELPKPKPKRPKGRRPTGDLGPKHDRFRVLDGGKDEGGDKPKDE